MCFSLQLLWRTDSASARRGPKPSLTIEHVVVAAVAIADADGLDELSMRHLAEQLGVGTMTLYRYVPGKPELLDLMVDHVLAEAVHDAHAPEGRLRERVRAIADANDSLHRSHPWLIDVYLGRPPMGPGTMAKYEHELRLLDGLGLSDVEIDQALSLILSFV